ncbi:DUF3080 family protein [Methylophaga sp. OBS4]|uniref:DUF3080 family protein n=1 Tax=Methylophaga sp. OBS4 TaxID=2991935 RepID=UPI002253CACE|nr:DUF3080 family protein [Methylophaga sp. OBS4]MCX4186948.1 DUF3080 domain-containing protein [Methylophaga sp. OBS4]
MLLLTACDPFEQPDTMMDEYVERLAWVLETESMPSPIPDVMTIPRPRDRRIDIPRLDINMLDFLSLYGCELQVIVGERNSILGRMMSPLNHLRYELRFIAAAEKCLPRVDKPQLETSLKEAIQYKKQILPATIWNAIWSGDEIANLLSLSKGYFPLEGGTESVSVLATDLQKTQETVDTLLNGVWEQDLTYLSKVQQGWAFSSHAGQLVNSARLITARLNDASRLMKQRLDERPLCYGGKPNNQARQLESMFSSVYIGRVQPYVSDASRASKQIFGLLESMAEQQKNIMPASFKDYYRTVLSDEAVSSVWYQFDRALKQHTELWQTLLEQCGMRPEAN